MPLTVTGGDGALYHALQHLAPPFPEITLIPKGRGNALARDLRAMPAVAAIDVLEVEIQPAHGASYRRWCTSSVSFGYATEVTRRAERFRPLRRLSYAAASTLSRPRWQDFWVRFGTEPAQIRRLTGVLVNNTRHVGGFVGFPQASCADGMADVMETRSGYPAQMLHNIFSMLKLHVWCPARFTQVRAAEIRAPHPQQLMLDGELVDGIIAVKITVHPGLLRCRAPQNTAQ